MMYRTCPLCGSNLDPCETCDCKEEKANTQAERTIHAAAYGEVYQDEYEQTYLRMKRESLPPCIADDIADTAAKNHALSVAGAALKNYRTNKRRILK